MSTIHHNQLDNLNCVHNMSDNLDNTIKKYEEAEEAEEFSDVIQLTEYEGNPSSNRQTSMVVAEYNPVQSLAIASKYEEKAKNLVNKIKDFIITYGGLEAQEDVVTYLTQVAELEISGLADMMQLCAINKMMIDNVVNRINATMAEDYAAIQTYNTLVTQHMKLMKELQSRYRSIPQVMKRMKVDVETEQELPEAGDNVDGVITEEFGETQFNSDKELMAMLNKKSETNK